MKIRSSRKLTPTGDFTRHFSAVWFF